MQDISKFHSPQVSSLPSSHKLFHEMALSYTVLNLALSFVAMFEALQAKIRDASVNDYPKMLKIAYILLTIGPCFSVG